MPEFIESGLRFNFPDSWIVLKSDTHRFYSYLSGRGFKGVDFMAIANNHLYLIEVKNYEDRYPEDGLLPIEMLLNHPEEYAENYIQKFEDSVQLIRIIAKYYKRQFWYKWFWKFFSRLIPEKRRVYLNPEFWPKANDLLSHQAFSFILWLEPGSAIKKNEWMVLDGKLQRYFDNYFKGNGQRIRLMNQSDHINEIDVTSL